MARKRDRTFAAFGAILFLLTSSALTIAVVLSMVQSKNTSNNTKSNNMQSPSSNNKNTPKLQGTNLSNFTPVASIPKLEVIDLKPGNGEAIKAGAKVTVDYTGAVASTGTIFQSSLDSGQPVSFSLKGVSAGWTEGMPGMKVGGTRRLLIPSSLAYGSNPPTNSGIPANADLVFDVTLHSISK
ncbi:MAG TPA: FKBP-type peptidyl-prolyl cis-trans isomerase [Patescibacteria group bacterium]|nr:FKBP-type peptidyl-prolyl cis-trans isomerase [Patescibacteria group bacterium]